MAALEMSRPTLVKQASPFVPFMFIAHEPQMPSLCMQQMIRMIASLMTPRKFIDSKTTTASCPGTVP